MDGPILIACIIVCAIPPLVDSSACYQIPYQLDEKKYLIQFNPQDRPHQKLMLGFQDNWPYLNFDGTRKYWLYCTYEKYVNGAYYFVERTRCYELVVMLYHRGLVRARISGNFGSIDQCRVAIRQEPVVTIGVLGEKFNDYDIQRDCPFQGLYHPRIVYPDNTFGCINDDSCSVKAHGPKLQIRLAAPRAGEKRPFIMDDIFCGDRLSGTSTKLGSPDGSGDLLLLMIPWPDNRYKALYCTRYKYLDPHGHSMAISIVFSPDRPDLVQAYCKRDHKASTAAPYALTLILRSHRKWRRERCSIPSRFRHEMYTLWTKADDYIQIKFQLRKMTIYKKTTAESENACDKGFTQGSMFYFIMDNYCYRVALMAANSLFVRRINTRWIDAAHCLKDVPINDMPISLAPITNKLAEPMVCPFANSKYQAIYKGRNSRFQCVRDQASTVNILDGRITFSICDGTSQTDIEKFRRITLLCGDTIAGSFLDSDHNGRAIFLYTEGVNIQDREFYCARYINAKNAIQLSIVIHPGRDPDKNMANCIENHSAVSGSKKALTLKLTDMDESNMGGDNEPEEPDDFGETQEDKTKKYTFAVYVALPVVTGVIFGAFGYCIGSCSARKKT